MEHKLRLAGSAAGVEQRLRLAANGAWVKSRRVSRQFREQVGPGARWTQTEHGNRLRTPAQLLDESLGQVAVVDEHVHARVLDEINLIAVRRVEGYEPGAATEQVQRELKEDRFGMVLHHCDDAHTGAHAVFAQHGRHVEDGAAGLPVAEPAISRHDCFRVAQGAKKITRLEHIVRIRYGPRVHLGCPFSFGESAGASGPRLPARQAAIGGWPGL